MIGKTLSHFTITAKLGEGGMGEVYRAEDTRLGRDVAIKVLPEAVAEDPERLARFEREAKVLAALDHSNIAAIYGLESVKAGTEAGHYTGDGTSVNFLVMQLAEGETLQARIARGAIPPDEAIPIALQIAEAVEAAHEKGIIHRDLKPANVMLGPDDEVKVLDFGLAKALDLEARSGRDSGSLSMSPTLTANMTGAGVILGTAAYMSPEQARGQEADERSDIWSFGVVLYEMLTGRQGFRGDTVSDTLASILKEQPDLDALPANTPRAVRRVLDRCLEKKAKDRLHSIADARIDLQASENSLSEPSVEEATAPERRIGGGGLIVAATAGALVTLGLIQLWPGGSSEERASEQFHLTINPPDEISRAYHAVISRQGDFVVFEGFDGSTSKLYLRRLGDFEAQELPGTEGGMRPVISPDGLWVAFLADGRLKKVAVAGGDPLNLCDLEGNSPGHRWVLDDTILFTPTWVESGLHRVSVMGGDPEPVSELQRAAGELGHWWPHVLPGEKNALFTIWPEGSGLNEAKVAVLNLDSGQHEILFDGADARYLSSGHVLYFHAGNWLVVPFDLEALAVTGPSVVVLPDAARFGPNAGNVIRVSVSDDGTLVYVPDLPDGEIYWFDRQGQRTRWPFEPANIESIDLGPDGRLAATYLEGGAYEIRILDPENATQDRFVFGDGSYFGPVWHPSGSSIAFTAVNKGKFDVATKTLGAAEHQILVSSGFDESAHDWSSDGLQVIYNQADEQSRTHLWTVAADGQSEPLVLTSGQASEFGARVSPDGRWLAFRSDRAGRGEVFVQRFPAADQVFKVSRSGGSSVRWAENSQLLYYKRGTEIIEVSFRLGRGTRRALRRRYWHREDAHRAQGHHQLVRRVGADCADWREQVSGQIVDCSRCRVDCSRCRVGPLCPTETGRRYP